MGYGISQNKQQNSFCKCNIVPVNCHIRVKFLTFETTKVVCFCFVFYTYFKFNTRVMYQFLKLSFLWYPFISDFSLSKD